MPVKQAGIYVPRIVVLFTKLPRSAETRQRVQQQIK